VDLQELLDEHGLDADGIERTLEWAKGRADELVSDLEEGSELRELLGQAPARRRARRLAREDLPPVPSAAPEAVEDDDDSVDIPIDDHDDDEEEISIDDGDIEMLDDEDLEEIVEDEEEAEDEGDGAEPDLLALAEQAEDTRKNDMDLPPEKDAALDALVASLDVGED
jgi:hypothetical protein